MVKMPSSSQVFGAVTASLTALILYQIIYYSMCISSMGDKYQSFKWVMYQVVSLVPAVLLGIHTTLKLFRPQTSSSKLWWVFSGAYFAVGIFFTAFFFYSMTRLQKNQVKPVTVPSFHMAVQWQVYYFGVLVFGPSVLVSLIYAFTPKEVAVKASPIEKVEQFLSLEAQNNYGEVMVEENEQKAHFML